MELQDVLKSNYLTPHISIRHYRLDDIKVADQLCGLKRIEHQYHGNLRDIPERCRTTERVRCASDPSEAAPYPHGRVYVFLHLRRNVTTCKKTILGYTVLDGCRLVAFGDDFTAFTFCSPLQRSMFGVKARSYITERTLMKLTTARRLKYEEVHRGST